MGFRGLWEGGWRQIVEEIRRRDPPLRVTVQVVSGNQGSAKLCVNKDARVKTWSLATPPRRIDIFFLQCGEPDAAHECFSGNKRISIHTVRLKYQP